MGERKGLFSRFFGRKKKDAPAETAPEQETASIQPAPLAVEEHASDPVPPAESPAPAAQPIATEPPVPTAPTPPDPAPADPVPVADRATQEAAPLEGEALPTAQPVDPAPAPEEEPAAAPAPALESEPAPVLVDPGPDTPDTPTVLQDPPSAPDAEAEAPEAAEPPAADLAPKRGLFGRLAAGLSRTSQKLSTGIGAIFTKRKLDDDTLEELEDLLITADLGVPAATRIIAALSKGRYNQEITDEEVRAVLAEEICQTLEPLQAPLTIDPAHRPHIILMTGVNGAGKTTTIGKLAKKFSDEGKSVLLAAGDTFRAAAIEQLKVWGERTGAPVVAKETGADAAGLAFDAITQAQDQNIDVVMIDTAGRLQNRRELMDELAKIVRVIQKLVPDAPHDTLLVLDATVGQNALSQAATFTEIAGVSGLVMTKLDGTARGGVLVALGDRFALPIHYIGVGEGVEDLHPFAADDFARALTAADEDTP